MMRTYLSGARCSGFGVLRHSSCPMTRSTAASTNYSWPAFAMRTIPSMLSSGVSLPPAPHATARLVSHSPQVPRRVITVKPTNIVTNNPHEFYYYRTYLPEEKLIGVLPRAGEPGPSASAPPPCEQAAPAAPEPAAQETHTKAKKLTVADLQKVFVAVEERQKKQDALLEKINTFFADKYPEEWAWSQWAS